MAKRPNLLASIDMETGQGKASPVTAIAPVVAPTPQKAKPQNVKTSLYLPPKAHHKLKEIALAKGCKVHDLVIDGIDKVLTENGFPTVSSYSSD